MHHRFTHAPHGSAHHEAASASRPSQHGRLASRTCWTVAVSRSNEARATSCAYLQTAEETCDSMPSSIAAPVTCGVPVSRGRARLATAVNVARTPARHRATIRTTPWRHETSARNGGTARSFVQLRPLPSMFFSVQIPLPEGAFSPFPLFRAHAHSVLQSLAGEPEAAAVPVSPQSAFAVTPPPMRARSLRLTCAHGQGGRSVARRPCVACAFICADADEEKFFVCERNTKPKSQPQQAQA